MQLSLRSEIYNFHYQQPEAQTIELAFNANNGTSFHTYLMKGISKTVMIDIVPIEHFDAFMTELSRVISPSAIDYLVLHQANPSLAKSIEKLLILAPQIKIACSATSHRFLKQMISPSLEATLLNTGDVFDLGSKSLKFYTTPFAYWPDALMSFCPEEGFLFSGELFSIHHAMCDPSDTVSAYWADHIEFFDHFFSPYKAHLRRALNRVKNLQLTAVLPAHGPIWQGELDKLVEIYESQLSVRLDPDKKCLIAYASAYGSTAEIAEHIAKGVLSVGGIDVDLIDITQVNPEKVIRILEQSDGFLLGSPTIHADAPSVVWTFLGQLNPIAHGRKHAATFGSYGWSGEASQNLSQRLEQLKMKVSKSFSCHFNPSEDELMSAYQFGAEFGDRLNAVQEITVEMPIPKIKNSSTATDVKKLWRCIICGEIFEGPEPPEVCPACGANALQFEVLEDVPPKQSAVSGAAIVIIGNNAAGTAACEAIRKRSEDASIILISEEKELGYYRPMLSDYLSDSYNEAKFYLHSVPWYAEHYIDLRLGTTISEIRPHHKCIVTSKNEIIYYDKLILAMGAKNAQPAIADIHLEGVFSLRTLADADAILAFAKTSKHVFVVGGGVLGLETAWELKNLGLEVTVLEVVDRLLPRQLDRDSSARLEKSVKASGIEVITGTKVVAMLGEDQVEAVQLLDGRIIETDMVILSVGITPNKELAQSAGIHNRVGIIVDAHMQTNMKDVYACGDVAEFEGKIYGLWAVATEQGKIAGANAVGDDMCYTATEPPTVFNGVGESIFSIGDVAAFESKGYESVSDSSTSNHSYKKLYFDHQGIFVGGILIGDVRKSLVLMRALPKRTSKEILLPQIFQ